MTPNICRIKQAINEKPMTRAEVIAALGIKPNSVDGLLKNLIEQGLCRRTVREGCKRPVYTGEINQGA